MARYPLRGDAFSDRHAYVGGRFGASRFSTSNRYSTSLDGPPPSTTTIIFSAPLPQDREDTEWNFNGAGLLGTQYTPHERFGFFGEAGVNLTFADESPAFGSERAVATALLGARRAE